MRSDDTVAFFEWRNQADENVEKWGLQNEEILLLAIQEELGELTQAYLESEYEEADPSRVPAELSDLGALLIQLRWSLQEGSSDGE